VNRSRYTSEDHDLSKYVQRNRYTNCVLPKTPVLFSHCIPPIRSLGNSIHQTQLHLPREAQKCISLFAFLMYFVARNQTPVKNTCCLFVGLQNGKVALLSRLRVYNQHCVSTQQQAFFNFPVSFS